MEASTEGNMLWLLFLTWEKLSTMFDTMDSGIKYSRFDLPTKMTRWLYDFLVGRIIQVNVNGFMSNRINPKAAIPQSSLVSSVLFLICVNDLPTPHHKQNSSTIPFH